MPVRKTVRHQILELLQEAGDDGVTDPEGAVLLDLRADGYRAERAALTQRGAVVRTRYVREGHGAYVLHLEKVLAIAARACARR